MKTALERRLPPENAYRRHAMLALEVLDAVTLERVSSGLTVTAHGLGGKQLRSWGGLFVWLQEDRGGFTGITIEPGTLPYERAEIPLAQVRLPVTVVELAPRPAYPFAAGVTAVRARLVEDRIPPIDAVADAEVWLLWLDDDGATWREAPTHSHTDSHGDFAAVARLVATDVPRLDASGALSARLRARRAVGGERTSAPFALAQGRVADALTFAWGELQP